MPTLSAYLIERSKAPDSQCPTATIAYIGKDLRGLDKFPLFVICCANYFQAEKYPQPYAKIVLPWKGTQATLEKEVNRQCRIFVPPPPPPVIPPPPPTGLRYRYYEGDWDVLPEFNTLVPSNSGSNPNIDIGCRPAGKVDGFAFVWEGYIDMPKPGAYVFEIVSDDGSKLYFDQYYSAEATPIIQNDGLHGPWTSAFGTVEVTEAGLHPFALTYFEKDGGEALELYWAGPGMERQRVPNEAFHRHPSPKPEIELLRDDVARCKRALKNLVGFIIDEPFQAPEVPCNIAVPWSTIRDAKDALGDA